MPCKIINRQKVCAYPRTNWWKQSMGIDFIGGESSSVETPTVQATDIIITDITDATLSFSLTRGNGDNILIIGKAGSAVDQNPVDGQTYNIGDDLGGGNIVVAKGTVESSFTTTTLTENTYWHLKAIEANSTVYLTDSDTGNPVNELTFCEQTQAGLDASTDEPDLDRRKLINAFLRYLIIQGIYATRDLLLLTKNGAHSDLGGINWKNPAANKGTDVGSVSVTADGVAGNGVDSYRNLNFNAAVHAVNFALNNSCLEIYVVDNVASTGIDMGVTEGGKSIYIQSRISGINEIGGRINDSGTWGGSSGITTSVGLTGIERTGANARNGYKNGVALTADTRVSIAFPNGNWYLGCQNNAGVAANFVPRRYGLLHAGSSMTAQQHADMHNAAVNYLSGNIGFFLTEQQSIGGYSELHAGGDNSSNAGISGYSQEQINIISASILTT